MSGGTLALAAKRVKVWNQPRGDRLTIMATTTADRLCGDPALRKVVKWMAGDREIWVLLRDIRGYPPTNR